MKINEVEFKEKVKSLYNGELEVISHFKGLTQPILVKDQYGVMQLPNAKQVLNNRPDIKVALNQTEYFMNQLREKYPEIAEKISPVSEYKRMKDKMLFNTKFGLISLSPDALLSGHAPSIRSAVNRKDYMRNQLLYLYENKYDFIITSTDRHKGTCTLICPIHGEVLIDNDHIFTGCGCSICNNTFHKSDTLYVVKLTSNVESFYKLGITFIKNGQLRRIRDYKKLGYKVEVLTYKTFSSYEECFEKEFKLKQLIKNDLYTPSKWANETSTECFQRELLDIVLENI